MEKESNWLESQQPKGKSTEPVSGEQPPRKAGVETSSSAVKQPAKKTGGEGVTQQAKGGIGGGTLKLPSDLNDQLFAGEHVCTCVHVCGREDIVCVCVCVMSVWGCLLCECKCLPWKGERRPCSKYMYPILGRCHLENHSLLAYNTYICTFTIHIPDFGQYIYLILATLKITAFWHKWPIYVRIHITMFVDELYIDIGRYVCQWMEKLQHGYVATWG